MQIFKNSRKNFFHGRFAQFFWHTTVVQQLKVNQQILVLSFFTYFVVINVITCSLWWILAVVCVYYFLGHPIQKKSVSLIYLGLQKLIDTTFIEKSFFLNSNPCLIHCHGFLLFWGTICHIQLSILRGLVSRDKCAYFFKVFLLKFCWIR